MKRANFSCFLVFLLVMPGFAKAADLVINPYPRVEEPEIEGPPLEMPKDEDDPFVYMEEDFDGDDAAPPVTLLAQQSEEGAELEEVEVHWSDRPIQQHWKAKRGGNMTDVLAAWSDRAGVDFVWDSSNDFVLLETVDANETYEDAVRRVLDQYKDSQIRPVGSLHIDPQNGERVLIVQDAQ